jgi:hypothetical protein
MPSDQTAAIVLLIVTGVLTLARLKRQREIERDMREFLADPDAGWPPVRITVLPTPPPPRDL